MKTKHHLSILIGRARRTMLLLSLASLLATAATAAENSVSELLEKGIYSEESKGDLDAAMKLYEQVVSEAKGGQAVAAQAQYRLGMCYYKKKSFSQATEAFDNGFHKLLHFLGVGLVGLEGMGAYALGQKIVDHRLDLVGRGRIADGDVGAIVSESPGDRSAYAARAAGDESNFARKIEEIGHGAIPSQRPRS